MKNEITKACRNCRFWSGLELPGSKEHPLGQGECELTTTEESTVKVVIRKRPKDLGAYINLDNDWYVANLITDGSFYCRDFDPSDPEYP